jgi:mannose-1-phosphate guanylyltransferase
MLRIWLDLCQRHHITDVLVNIHSHAGIVRNYLRSQDAGIRVEVSQERDLLGSAGTLRANRGWIKSEPIFFVFYADVLTNTNLDQMLVFHRSKSQIATLGVYQVPDPQRCGIVNIDQHDVIRSFVEKPAHPESNLAFSGLLVASSKLLDFLPQQTPADLGFHVFPQLAGRMAAYRITDYLSDVGTLDNYYAAQTNWPKISFNADQHTWSEL